MNVRSLPAIGLLILTSLAAGPTMADVCSDTTFLSQRYTINAIDQDQTRVFVGLSNGALLSLAKATGAQSTVADVTGSIQEVAHDTTNLYFSVPGFTSTNAPKWSLYSVPLAGGVLPTLVFDSSEAIDHLKVDDTSFYWIVPSSADTAADGKLQKLSKSGGVAQTLASGLAVPWDMELGSQDVFLNEAGTGQAPWGLLRIGKNGGAPVRLDGTFSGRHVISAGANVVYSVREKLDYDSIYSIPAGGGTPVAVKKDVFDPTGLVIESSGRTLQSVGRFDWTNGNYGFVKALEGATETTLYNGPVRYFVSDAEAIYAVQGVSSGGKVERLCLNYATAPHIDSFDGNGAPNGGSKVAILGQRFAQGARVTFDGREGSVLSVTSTRIEVVAPAHDAGFVTVYVINPDGQSGRNTFYYDPTMTSGPARRRAIDRN